MAEPRQTCVDCGADGVRVFLSGVPLCDRCADRRISRESGWPELPDPPPERELVGPDGRTHRLRFRLWRSPVGVVAEAEEVGGAVGAGYHAAVTGPHDADVDHLIAAVQNRIDAEIGRLYLAEASHRSGWVLRGDEVAGRLVWSSEDEPYAVVVDGRTLSWDELGRALEPFEGWEFRLDIGDTDVVEEPGEDAEVVALPVADESLLAGIRDLFIDDEDEEAFFQQWEQAEREAVVLLRDALPEVVAAQQPHDALRAAVLGLREGIAAGRWPYRHLASVAGWGSFPPADDLELWLGAVGGLVGMREESGLGSEQESALMTLEHPDWTAAVIGLVRAGPGARAEPSDLIDYLNACPEVDVYAEDDDVGLVATAFEIVLPAWEAAGAVDGHRRLTPLGWWGLPRALGWAWKAEFDAPPEPE